MFHFRPFEKFGAVRSGIGLQMTITLFLKSYAAVGHDVKRML